MTANFRTRKQLKESQKRLARIDAELRKKRDKKAQGPASRGTT